MTDYNLYAYEEKLAKLGITYIAGIDEAGRGPLAGPVVAAAVILKPGVKLKYVNDSKKLSEKQRDKALIEVKENALAIGIGMCSVEEIDKINIYRAAREAMISAIKQLKITPEFLLIDAMPIEFSIPSESIIKGDQKYKSIAAASILAKTHRDEYMQKIALDYPYYDWQNNQGYPTKKHRAAILIHGKCEHHRSSFKLLAAE